jgi:hypothetical protein
MTRLSFTALRRAITSRRHVARPVHFHNGPQGEPAVCFDECCDSPRLDVH